MRRRNFLSVLGGAAASSVWPAEAGAQQPALPIDCVRRRAVSARRSYTAALTLISEWLPRIGVTVTQVDQSDIEAFRQAIGPKTRLVYTETPTNPTMTLTDLDAVAALGRKHGAADIGPM